jgi:hypothetical protein
LVQFQSLYQRTILVLFVTVLSFPLITTFWGCKQVPERSYFV